MRGSYTDNIDEPDYLWSEAGSAFRTLAGDFQELEPLDLLLGIVREESVGWMADGFLSVKMRLDRRRGVLINAGTVDRCGAWRPKGPQSRSVYPSRAKQE